MPSPRFAHNFANDVFLSYSRKDDEADVSRRNWVTQFERDLKTQLEQNSGRTVRFWRDQRLNAADRFDQEIFDQLRASAILVPILTRNYFNSDYCTQEWSEFIRLASDVGNSSRMVKVAKTFVPLTEYPKELLATNQHAFFVQEGDDRYRQYHLHPDPRYEREYAAHVDDVAQDIERVLARMEGAPAATQSKGAVFVAETSSDLNPERDRICRMLAQMRYEVLPRATLHGLNAPQIRQAVERDVAAARLAILPVGAYYGIVPELGAGASIVRIQLETAARDRRNGDFPRLVWMPKDLQAAEPTQQQFIQEIREVWARSPFEVLEVLPHQLQEVIENRLNPPKSPAARPEPEDGGEPARPSVYVLSEPQDADAAFALRQWFFSNDFEVPPSPESWDDPARLREELRERFANDDAFVVFYGNSNSSWVTAQVREVSKAAGMGRKSPILAKGVFLADPENSAKKQLLVRETLLRGFSPAPLDEVLAPFAAEIRRKWIAQASPNRGPS